MRICLFVCQTLVAFLDTHFSIVHFELSGDEGIRTPDLRRAKAALSQLSYIPGKGRILY